MRGEHVAGTLGVAKLVAIDEQRACAIISCTLSTERIWPGIFASMLWHWSSMNDTSLPSSYPPPRDDFEQDAKQLEGIGRADDEVVVGVEPGVEVERAEATDPQQLHDDELDVGAGCVVPRVEADDRALTERDAVRVRRTPVRHVGRVERGLEELVLEHQALVAAEAPVHLAQRISEALLAITQITLTRVVEPVGKPDLEVAAAGDVHDVDALVHVRDRLRAHAFVAWHRLPSL